MSDEMDLFEDQFDQEIALIKASGNNKVALEKRLEQYQATERDLLDHINRKTWEQAGRRAAWVLMSKKIE